MRRDVHLPILTDRQRDLLRFLQLGYENKRMATELGISIKTVESHLTRLYRKLNVQNRLEAVNFTNRFPQILGIKDASTLKPEKKIQANKADNLSILVLDDSIRYRRQLLNMIGKANSSAAIYEAENIAEAMNLMKKIDFQLAFIDVILRDENGINGTQKIHRINPHTRIVLISAYPDREFHRQGLASGASAFLDKKNLDHATIKQVIEDNL